MDPVSGESFWSSKTMILLMVSMGTVVFLIAIGVAVKVLFGEDVFSMIGMGIAAVTGQAGSGVYRNVAVDGSNRQTYAQAAVTPPTTPPVGPYGSGPPGGQQ